jgi:hypothetical protein
MATCEDDKEPANILEPGKKPRVPPPKAPMLDPLLRFPKPPLPRAAHRDKAWTRNQ